MCAIASTLLSLAVVGGPIVWVPFASLGPRTSPPPGGVEEIQGPAGPIRVGDVVLMLGSPEVPAFRIARVSRIEPPLLRLVGTVDVAAFRARPGEVIPFSRAVAYCNNRVAAEPGNDAHYTRRALVWLQLGERDRALADLDAAIRLNPHDPEAYLLRGDLRTLKEDDAGARADHERALALHQSAWGSHRGVLGTSKTRSRSLATRTFRPRTYYPPTFFLNRGVAAMRWGNYAQALADCDTAQRLDASSYPAFNNRAWVYATAADPASRDPVEAMANATRACELTDWKNPWTLDTLAAVYADRGDFARAVYTEQEALARCKGTEHWVPRYRARLALYKAETPYRMKPGAEKGDMAPDGAPGPGPGSPGPDRPS
jgi:tetratricopeptide (TPR) repeat protein